MGGDITVESVEGRGTDVQDPAVRRRCPRDPSDVEPCDGALSLLVDGDGDLVLVIDDEASQRELMSRFLRRQGFAVRTAADGASGIDVARSSNPRVILLDVMMPGMDGWSVLEALKDDPATAATARRHGELRRRRGYSREPWGRRDRAQARRLEQAEARARKDCAARRRRRARRR